MTRSKLKARTREVFRGVLETPCWDWQDCISNQGYGTLTLNGKGIKAHRLSYLLHVGPIPIGMVLDHLCHTHDKSCQDGNNCLHRRCCNPMHLEPVTQQVNLDRGRRGKGSVINCKNGHPLSGKNLHITTAGGRQCKICLKATQAKLYKAQKVERAAWQKAYYERNREKILAREASRYQSKKELSTNS